MRFFLGNVIAAYVLTLLVCVVYFVIRFRSTFARHVNGNLPSLIAGSTAAFVPFAALSFMAAFLTSVLSYRSFGQLGSSAGFDEHLAANIELTFLDPLAASVFTLLVLLQPVNYAGEVPVFLFAAVGTFLVTRLWQAVVARFALATLHQLRGPTYFRAFALNYLPAFVVGNILLCFTVWLIVVLMVIGGD